MSPISAGRPEFLTHRHAVRDSLTVLAILLIAVLTAALVGPYVVDWGSHRALIERRLSDAAGTPVTVAGPIDLKLLPKPVFRLGGVAVGDGAGGRPRLSAASLDAELSLAALMRGQVQFVDATLVHPELRLIQAPDGGFGLGLPSDAAADRVAFDHLGVRNGALDLTLADGRHLALTGIDLDGEAAALRGPFKAAGSVGALPFRLATGTPDGGRLRVKLHLDGAGARPALDLDGTAAARPGALGPGFDGTATASGQMALDGTPAAVPWRATARLSADRDGARASDLEIRAGADLRAMIASGDGSATYAAGSAPPRAALTLRGAALDADSLAVPPPNSDIAPPGGPDVLRLLLRDAGGGHAALRIDVDAAFDTATLAGRTALATAARVRLGSEPGAGLAFSVEGPGGARLALDGRVEPEPPPSVAGPFGAAPAAPAAAFHGRIDIRAGDLRRTAAWLRPAAPDLIDRLAATLPARSLGAAGAVEVSDAGIFARDLDLHLDGTALSGTLSLARSAGTARLSADLSADALDLDRVPDLARVGAASRGLDLDLSLAARAVRLGSSSVGAVAAGQVALHVTRSGDDARLEKLALDLGGAHLDASGARDAAGGRGSLRVAAAAVGPLAEALAPILSAPAAAALRARAALLSPLDATATLDAAADPDGALVPARLAVAGRAGEVTLDGALTPDGPAAGRAAADRPVALSLQLAAPRGADLLRLVGLPPGSVAGAASVSASARGTLAGGVTGRVEASLGDTSASFAGRAAAAEGEGRLTLHSADLRPVLASVGLTASAAAVAAEAAGDLAWDGDALRWRGLSARVGGSAATGDLSLDLAQKRAPSGEPLPVLHGRLALDRLPAESLLALALGPVAAPSPGSAWSSTSFAAPPTLPRSELALTVGTVPVGRAIDGRGASLTLRTAPDSVALADIAGAVADGSVAGALSIRRDGPGATLSGRLAWRDLAVDGGGLAARTSGAEDLAAAGDSPAALVASLAGTGTVSLSGVLSRTDPTAPARVLAAVTARDALAERGSNAPEPTPPDGEALRRDLDAALDAGPLPVEAAKGSAVLAGGVLSLGPLRRTGTVALPRTGREGTAAADWSAETTLSLDLRKLALATRVDLGAAPAGGVVATVTRAGPLGGAASRAIDVGGLVEAVQAGAVARAQDRIDVLEQDIRERAAFNRQLKAIAQRQQMEREQAEAARRAEIARVAAEAQARAAAARAAALAAADAQRAAAEAQRQAAEQQKAEDARLQAQLEAAARERNEAEKLRAVDRALKMPDSSLDHGAGRATSDGPLSPPGRAPRLKGRDPFDLPPPPSIIQERDEAR